MAAAASGCGSTSEKSVSKTFTSPTYGYTIALPSGWSAIPADRVLPADGPPLTGGGGTDIIGANANQRVSKMELPALVIGAQGLLGTTSLDGWKAAVTRIVAKQKGCKQPRSSERLNVGGDTAVMLEYPDCPRGSGLYHLWTVIVHKGRGFHVVWFGRSENETKDRPLLDDVLASFSFMK
jgi:hypothetical protein